MFSCALSSLLSTLETLNSSDGENFAKLQLQLYADGSSDVNAIWYWNPQLQLWKLHALHNGFKFDTYVDCPLVYLHVQFAFYIEEVIDVDFVNIH